MIENFQKIFPQRYQIARQIKAQGKRVLGWVCIYVPEEIIYAAGFHPIRIVGSQTRETPIADAFLYSNNCTFSRSVLEEGLSGKLDFLDGFIACNTCDHIRRLYDIWQMYLKIPYTKALGVPCKVSKATLDYFTEELALFRRELEERFSVTITDESLRHAIQLYNKSRALLSRLFNWRKEDPPPLWGWEAAEIIRSGWYLPREEYVALLEELLEVLPKRDRTVFQDHFRLLLCGSELDDPNYYRIIEEAGGIVVIDALCGSYRYFTLPIEDDSDPIRAIAYRYLRKPMCGRMHPASTRIKTLQELAQEYRIDGVIHQSIKFCDNYAGQFTLVKAGFEEIGIPVLNLEREYVLAGSGQMKTRIEAFFESLEGRFVRE
jgi:bzd-type benzoyl-CoA reductase N subunit